MPLPSCQGTRKRHCRVGLNSPELLDKSRVIAENKAENSDKLVFIKFHQNIRKNCILYVAFLIMFSILRTVHMISLVVVVSRWSFVFNVISFCSVTFQKSILELINKYTKTYRLYLLTCTIERRWMISRPNCFIEEKLIEKSRDCHNHKQQPIPDNRRKRKRTQTNA